MIYVLLGLQLIACLSKSTINMHHQCSKHAHLWFLASKSRSRGPSRYNKELLWSTFGTSFMWEYGVSLPSTSHWSLKCQSVKKNRILACANPLKSVDAATNPPAMTPEEKIEKLRRRQHLRVILAIQKPQQQFGNPVSAEDSTIKGGNVEVDENIIGFPSLDHNSAIGHDDNNAVKPLSICSMEESVLRRLQDSISRLDMQIRLCIGDSLFLLSKSAIQRHCPSDANSANKNVDSHEGFTGIPDV